MDRPSVARFINNGVAMFLGPASVKLSSHQCKTKAALIVELDDYQGDAIGILVVILMGRAVKLTVNVWNYYCPRQKAPYPFFWRISTKTVK